MDDTTTATLTRDCDPSTSYAFSGKLMLISVLILLIVCLFILFFHMYARWFFFRRSRHHQSLRLHRRPRRFSSDLTQTTTQGLDFSVLKSLPIFHYSSTTNSPPLECAVCLFEFEENERGRLLPRCNHCFHLDCIDMWFHFHSNCPLCRSPVTIQKPDEIRIPMSTATVTEPAGSGGGSDEPVCSTVETNEDARVMIEDVDPEAGSGNGFKPGAVGSLKSG